jgi:integrase
MLKILTELSVKRMRVPASGSIDVFDRSYPGLHLRLSYGGSKVFGFYYRYGGKQKRLTLGHWPSMTLAAAREAWRVARATVAEGRDPARVRSTAGTSGTSVDAAYNEWLQRDQAKRRTRYSVERAFTRDILPVLSGMAVAAVTKRDIVQIMDSIVDRGAPILANRTHSFLRRFFKWCCVRDLIPRSPMEHLPRPAVETSRDRVLSDAELTAVWKACDAVGWPFGPVTRLLILTGARRSEIAHLKWEEIVGDEIQLAGSRTKTGEPHTIPLSDTATYIIAQLPHVDGGAYVFSRNGRTPATDYATAKAKIDQIVQIPPWRIHDLRRTLATGLQRLGVALTVTEAVLGHVGGSRAGVIGIYQRHAYAAEKREALDLWARHVMDLVT